MYLRACSGGLRWRTVQVKGGPHLPIEIRPSILVITLHLQIDSNFIYKEVSD